MIAAKVSKVYFFSHFVLFLILLGTVTLTMGCDTANEQRTFIEDAQSAPSGISTTDVNGLVDVADSDDWRTAPVYVGRIVVDAAYPNPFENGVVTIPFRVLQFDEIVGGMFVRAFDTRGQLVTIDEVLETSSPGLYTFTINPAQLGTKGLHRLFVQDVFGEIVSYGDLMIN